MMDPGGPGRVALTIGETVLAVPCGAIRRVIPARSLTTVPLARPQVLGVLTLDRQAIPIYRLAGLSLPGGVTIPEPRAPRRTAGHVVVMEVDGVLAGFMVDGAETIRGEPDPEMLRVMGEEILMAAGVLPSQTGGEPAAQAVQGDR